MERTLSFDQISVAWLPLYYFMDRASWSEMSTRTLEVRSEVQIEDVVVRLVEKGYVIRASASREDSSGMTTYVLTASSHDEDRGTQERVVRLTRRDTVYDVDLAVGGTLMREPILREMGEFFHSLLPPIVPKDDGTIFVRFWYLTRQGPESRTRQIIAPQWGEIVGNYSVSTQDRLTPLFRPVLKPDGAGKLILFHGEPGTGKTYAIRSLAHAWRSWCDVDYLVDADEFFEHADYLMQVLLEGCGGPTNGPQADAKWRLIIIEDADEFITVDAKSRAGQGFARLLNVTEGFIGQGLRVLFLLTTNVTDEKFHPAIYRHGRCLAQVKFDAMSPAESNAWMQAHHIPNVVAGRSHTLADLYEIGRKVPEAVLAVDG